MAKKVGKSEKAYAMRQANEYAKMKIENGEINKKDRMKTIGKYIKRYYSERKEVNWGKTGLED
jgi:hypothetical protein